MTTDEITWEGAETLREHLKPISELRPFEGNARRGDIPALMESLRRFGQVRAVLTLPDNTIVAGHHITEACKRLGWTHVAAIPATFQSRDDARDYLVADNQLAVLGHIEDADQMTLLEEIEAKGSWEGTGYTADDLADMRALSRHKTEMVREEELKTHAENYREHHEDQLAHLTASLKEHGFYRNVVVANDGTVLAGHGILEAARKVGLKKIPVTRLPVAPDSPEALKVLAGDNELGKLGEIDDRQLSMVLKSVKESGDISTLLGTGYDAQTLASLIMVTRPASEIKDHDHAAEWLGLPGFEQPEERLTLTLSFDDEQGRDDLVERLELIISNKRLHAWSAWWPPRPTRDLSSVRFEGENPDVPDGEQKATMEDAFPEPVEQHADAGGSW